MPKSALRIDLETRLDEADAYLKFVTHIADESASLALPHKKSRATRVVDERVSRILKANFFLLLYNTVEATVRDGFRFLYERIGVDRCPVRELSDPFREAWLDAQFSTLTPNTANPDSYRAVARRVAAALVSDAVASIDISTLRLGGNLDAARIRGLCGAHGIETKTHRAALGGEKLLVVKANRNALAHGIVTFTECGRNYTTRELRQILKESATYLRSILSNIERFGTRRRYRVS
jgi:hypothetical protein